MLKQIERAAKREHQSISKWATMRLASALNTEWPPGYFDLCGSLPKGQLQRPPQPQFEDDVRRASL